MWNSFIDNNPSFYYEENLLGSYLTNDSINSSISTYHFPSSIIYDCEIDNYSEFLSSHELAIIQQASTSNTNSSPLDDKIEANKGDEVNRIVEDKMGSPCRGVKKRRRTSNKDRHSKIRTAHGLRDRRMRLSLEVARQFFRLEDMLGHDKGSETVEWLLTQSKAAIDELYRSKNNGGRMSGISNCTVSSTSECEAESLTVEQRRAADDQCKKAAAKEMKMKMKMKQMRLPTTKEARQKARDKARKRTLEKLMQSRGLDESHGLHLYDVLQVEDHHHVHKFLSMMK